MGCIPLLDSVNDYRFMAVITFWLAFGSLLLYSFLGRAGHYKRYCTCLHVIDLIALLSD